MFVVTSTTIGGSIDVNVPMDVDVPIGMNVSVDVDVFTVHAPGQN